MKLGYKVTIHSSGGSSSVPVAVTHITEVKTRQYVTADGCRWTTRGAFSHEEVDNKNQRISSRIIREYREGDEDRIVLARLVKGAKKLVGQDQNRLIRDLELLSAEDLSVLEGIAERLEAARKVRDSES